MRALELFFTVRCANGQPQITAAGRLNPDRRRGGQHRDSVVAQQSGDLVAHVLVLVLQQPCAVLDDGDLAAEPAEHLPEFQSDVAAADDDQVLRERV